MSTTDTSSTDLDYEGSAPLRSRIRQEIIMTKLKLSNPSFDKESDVTVEGAFTIKRNAFSKERVEKIESFLHKLIFEQLNKIETLERFRFILDGYSQKGKYLRNNKPSEADILKHLEKGYNTIAQDLHKIWELKDLSEELLQLYLLAWSEDQPEHLFYFNNLYFNQNSNYARYPTFHHDESYVAALQLAGSKQWIFPDHKWEIVLNPGDTIHVHPKIQHGCLPYENGTSTHLTLELTKEDHCGFWREKALKTNKML